MYKNKHICRDSVWTGFTSLRDIFPVKLSFRQPREQSYHGLTGLMLNVGIKGDCLHAPWGLPWCP